MHTNKNKYTTHNFKTDIIIRVLFIVLILLLMFLLVKKLKYDSCLSVSNDKNSESVLIKTAKTINRNIKNIGNNNAAPSPSGNTSQTTDPASSGALNLDAPMVALTFDDGSNNSTTGRILDVIEQYGCRATFFVVGNRLKANASSVQRASSLGCEIGSHSYDHAQLKGMKSSGIKKEFSKTNDVLKELIGKKAPVVRTPYGSTDKKVLKAVKYPVILWSIDSRDWETRNKKKTVKNIMNTVKDGDIILMHDLYEETADAVEVIVPRLLNQGYQLVTVSEMMEAKGIKLKPGHAYFNGRR